MSDLIGRFLSFEELMGRGLVKFAYYFSLFFLIVKHVYHFVTTLFASHFGDALLVPFKFILSLVVLRILTELVMAVLSIDENLRKDGPAAEGFEAGITPAPGTTMHDVAQAARPVKTDDCNDSTT